MAGDVSSDAFTVIQHELDSNGIITSLQIQRLCNFSFVQCRETIIDFLKEYPTTCASLVIVKTIVKDDSKVFIPEIIQCSTTEKITELLRQGAEVLNLQQNIFDNPRIIANWHISQSHLENETKPIDFDFDRLHPIRNSFIGIIQKNIGSAKDKANKENIPTDSSQETSLDESFSPIQNIAATPSSQESSQQAPKIVNKPSTSQATARQPANFFKPTVGSKGNKPVPTLMAIPNKPVQAEEKSEMSNFIIKETKSHSQTKSKTTKKQKKKPTISSQPITSKRKNLIVDDSDEESEELESPVRRLVVSFDDDGDVWQSAEEENPPPKELEVKKEATVQNEPSTSSSPPKRKKLVTKVFEDKDGFMVTEKVMVEVTESEDIPEVLEAIADATTTTPVGSQEKTKDAPSKGKKTSPKGKTKHASITSFFKKM